MRADGDPVEGAPASEQGIYASLTPEQVRDAIRLYGLGWPLGRIGERFAEHHSVILRALQSKGLARRDSHGRPRCANQ